MFKVMETTCQCAETLNGKGERYVLPGHNCAYVKKRSALVWPASLLADRDVDMRDPVEHWDAEELAVLWNFRFTYHMDNLSMEAGLL